MMMHDIFGENLFDDFMNDFAFPTFPAFTTSSMLPAFPDTEKVLYGKHAKNLMKTDIKESEDGYELIIDLPGFMKDELQVSLNDGYLTIQAAKGLDKDEQEKETGKYIRKERYAGSCARSFYVGDHITEEDIKGEFKHGILKLEIPKKEAKPKVEQKKYIAIEG